MFKKYFVVLVSLLLVSGIQVLSSHEPSSPVYFSKSFRGKVIDDKIYLHPGMAQVTPSGLMVQFNGEPLVVPRIESDEHGVFIRIQDVEGAVRQSDWCCTACWHWNSSNRQTCRICGSDRDD